MNQNDKRNAKISEVCRVLANACSSENTSLYPEDVMTFVNESRNSDIRELLALHIALNEIDAIKRLDKSLECAEAWHYYTRPLRRNGRRVVVRYPDRYSVEQIQKDYEEGFTYLENANALVLESEIVEYESVLAKDDVYAWLHESDNDIAYQTAYEIAEANAKREHMLSKIACDAVKKHVYYGTVVRFMNEMCKDDKERAFFLQEYSNAQWRDGRYN